MALLLSLLLWLVGAGAAAGQSAPAPDAPPPDNCEGNSARLDALRNRAAARGAGEVVIAIARLGAGERSRELNRRRLFTVRQYLVAAGLEPRRVLVAEAEAAQGGGRVEVYVGGELAEVLAARRNEDLPAGTCESEAEDRRRYQLPRAGGPRRRQ
ncbi:MAG TPA: hypothetical protein VF668_18265 [Pyrinomonadaceae bacterium]|jgi:hypothetical protein